MSRLVKLIFFIASTIGRASKLLMSICSTSVDSSSALRVSLMRASVVILVSMNSLPSRLREGLGEGVSECRGGTCPPPGPPASGRGVKLQRNDVRRDGAFLRSGVKRRQRLVGDDHPHIRSEAVEAGPHRAAIGAEHADLDIIEIGRAHV